MVLHSCGRFPGIAHGFQIGRDVSADEQHRCGQQKQQRNTHTHRTLPAQGGKALFTQNIFPPGQENPTRQEPQLQKQPGQKIIGEQVVTADHRQGGAGILKLIHRKQGAVEGQGVMVCDSQQGNDDTEQDAAGAHPLPGQAQQQEYPAQKHQIPHQVLENHLAPDIGYTAGNLQLKKGSQAQNAGVEALQATLDDAGSAFFHVQSSSFLPWGRFTMDSSSAIRRSLSS